MSLSENQFHGKPCRTCGGTLRYKTPKPCGKCVVCAKSSVTKRYADRRAYSIATGQTIFEGEPCRTCGNLKRYVKTRRCVDCTKVGKKRCADKYRERDRGKPRKRTNSKNFTMRLLDISVNEYYALCETQDWRCAICKEVPKRRLCIDHCHVKVKFRGLLCDPCNKGLGHFRDDPAKLEAAIEYLQSC